MHFQNFLFEVKSKYGQNALQMQRGILVSKEVHPQSLEVSPFVFWVDPCHAILDFQDHSPRVQDWIIMSLPLLFAGILLHFLGDYSLNLIKDDVVAKRRIYVNLGDLKEIHDIFCCKATFMCSVI